MSHKQNSIYRQKSPWLCHSIFYPQACRSRHDESKPKYDYGVVIPHKSSKSTENSDIHTPYKDIEDQQDQPGGVVPDTEQQIRWVFDDNCSKDNFWQFFIKTYVMGAY